MREKLNELIAESKFSEVFEILYPFLEKEADRYQDEYKQVLVLRSEYGRWKKNNSLGISLQEQANVQINRIIYALIQIINDIDELDQLKVPIEGLPIILGICYSEESKTKLSRAFDAFNLPPYLIVTADEYQEKIKEYNNFEVIVFDNRDCPFCSIRPQLKGKTEAEQHLYAAREIDINYCIDNTASTLIHLGDMIYWVTENRERIGAANAMFTLYARINEILNYRKVVMSN